MVHAAPIGGAWIGALRRALTILLIVCAALWLLALLMQAGVVRRQDNWAGPFVTEAPGSPVVVLRMGQSRPLPGLTDTGGDDLENPSRSNIAVTVAGERWEAGHTPHAELRAGKARAFSHWGNQLYLVLPAGLANGPQLVITADYTLQPRPWVTRTLMLALALLGALRFRIAIIEGRSQDFVRRLKALRRVALHFRGGPGGSRADYLRDVIIYGWIAGYALPTVALFDVFPAMRRLALWEPNAPNALFALAGVGAMLEWLIRLDEARSAVERPESIGMRRWIRLALLFGAVFLCLLFVMSNGGWRGVMNPADMNYMSIAGLLPHSDAADLFLRRDGSVGGRALESGRFATADCCRDPDGDRRDWGNLCGEPRFAGGACRNLRFDRHSWRRRNSRRLVGNGVCGAPAWPRTPLCDDDHDRDAWSWRRRLVGALPLAGPSRSVLQLGVGGLWARHRSHADPDGQHVHAALSCGLGHFLGHSRRGRPGGARGRRARRRGIVVGPVDPLAAVRRHPLGVGGDFSYILCGLTTGTDWYYCLPIRVASRPRSGRRQANAILYEKATQAFLADP